MEFLAKNDGINISVDGQYQKVSDFMTIKEVRHNIDDGTFKSILEYESLNGRKEILINREDYLNKNNLIKNQSKGLDITHENVNVLVSYLRQCEKKAIVKNIHTKLGFDKYENEYIYKLQKCIGIDSKYVGIYDIEPKGNKEEYVSMLKEEVIGNPALEFIIITALSAVILGYIGEELGLDTIIAHIVGNSTTGKSTALKLAISLFGYPDVKRNGLFGTYNGTNNALLKKLTGLKGVPYALDEISMSYTQNFTNFIYGLANGTDKDRLNKDSELKQRETWLTTILSNGEKSLIGSANKNAGVQIRVIEANNFVWTKDADNAERINRTILQNYGHIGFDFAKYIMNIEKDEVIKQFESARDEVYKIIDDKLVVDNMAIRRCNKFGIILHTAYLFQDMMGIRLDIDGIIGMMVEIEKESLSNRNFRESTIDYIKQYVSKYKNKFECGTTNSIESLGVITQREKYVEVQMNKLSFEQMIKQGGYEDKNIILRELKDAGYLNCEKDRYTRCRKNSLGYKEEFVVIKLDK